MPGYSGGRSDQLDVHGALKEHRTRIKNLEAVNVAVNAVLYDTHPQGAGHYLFSDTDTDGPTGFGTDLRSSSPGGLNLEATAGPLDIVSTDGNILIDAQNGHDLNLRVSGPGSGDIIAQLEVIHDRFVVQDAGSGGVEIFEVGKPGWIYGKGVTSGSPGGYGIELISTSNRVVDPDFSFGMWIEATISGAVFKGQPAYVASTNTLITVAASAAGIGSPPTAGVGIQAGGHILIQSASNVSYEQDAVAGTPIHKFIIPNTGAQLYVQTVGGTGLFRVDSDGSLHGLTGQSLTFDL